MAEKYDAVVVGSGPAGRAAAMELNKAGRKVAVVEDYGFGGTCPLRGCEPKKLLVDAADAVARARDMKDQGVSGTIGLDWKALMRFNRSLVEPISEKVETWLNYEGITTYFGKARFTGPNTLRTDEDELEGEKILIAAGAEPRPLKISSGNLVSTSDDFLELEELPERIVFAGGGFISFELGFLAKQAGANVTILEMAHRPLPPFDTDLVDLLVQEAARIGISIHVDSSVNYVKETNGLLTVNFGDNQTIEADMVVHGAGRVPAVRGMDLEKGNIEFTPKGITVNPYLQSVSNDSVYAAGDVAATPFPLTPVAHAEGIIAARNMLNGNMEKAEFRVTPSCVFTYPPLAAVGLTEEQARNQGLEFKTIFKDTSTWTEHKRIGIKCGGIKLLIDNENDKLIGAHILGERAEEMINILAFAMQQGLPLETLRSSFWAYPSFIYNLRYVLL